MSDILETYLGYGLIEGIDGNDERFDKIQTASQSLAERLKEKPQNLISAILEAIFPDSDLSMPVIAMAKECLQNEWKAFKSTYTEEPFILYRGIVLNACDLVAEEGLYASIMWLTACDIVPLLPFGNEKEVVTQFMERLANLAEQNSMVKEDEVKREKEKVVTFDKLEFDDLLLKIDDPNDPNDPNDEDEDEDEDEDAYEDAYEYTKTQFNEYNKSLNALIKGIESKIQSSTESFEKNLNSQRKATQNIQKNILKSHQKEQTMVKVLWWAEALYSPSQKKSYRACSAEIATVIMPFDLLELLILPTPASVVYTLSETLNKLPNASFEKECSFFEFLGTLRNNRQHIDKTELEQLANLGMQKERHILGLIVTSLIEEHCDLQTLIQKSFIPSDWKASLPAISQIIFRQAQAYKLLAESN